MRAQRACSPKRLAELTRRLRQRFGLISNTPRRRSGYPAGSTRRLPVRASAAVRTSSRPGPRPYRATASISKNLNWFPKIQDPRLLAGRSRTARTAWSARHLETPSL